MALNHSERNELNNRIIQELKQLTDAFQAEYELKCRQDVEEKRQNGAIPVVAGMNEGKYINKDSLELASEIYRQQGVNPYLPAETRKQIDYITQKALYYIDMRDSSEIRAQACENARKWFAEHNDLEKQAAADELREKARNEAQSYNRLIDTALPIMRCLNGEVSIDSISLEMKSRSFLALGTDLVEFAQHNRGTENQPERLDFVCETTARINREAFMVRYGTPGANPEVPDDSEREYAHASFGRAFNGIFGINGQSVPEGHPLFLGKFNNIFVDGKSVSQLCKDTTAGMDAKQANDYMTMFTTATALGRKSRIECVPPKTEFTLNADGTFGKTLGEGRQPGSSVIPVISKVKEFTPKPNWFLRLLNFLGLVRIVTAQSEYEKMLANDPDGKIRKDDIEGGLVRDEVQRTLLEILNNEGDMEDASNTFFHPDDLKDINPDIVEVDKHFDSNRVGGVLTLGRVASRLTTVRLYMLSKGYGLDQILSTDEAYNEDKREIGREFYKILHRGDPDEIGRVFVDMAQAMGNMELPDIDFSNDAQLVANYEYIQFLSDAATNLNQTIPLDSDSGNITPVKAAMDRMIGVDGIDNIGKTITAGRIVTGNMLNNRVPFIASNLYSDANPDFKRAPMLSKPINCLIPEGFVAKQSGEIANELFQNAKGNKLCQLDADATFKYMNDISAYAHEALFRSGVDENHAIYQRLLDYSTGKSLNDPLPDTRAKAEKSCRISPAPIRIMTEAEAKIKISLPEQAHKPKVENIDIGALGQDTGIKSAPKHEERDPLKPQPQSRVNNGLGL